MEKEKLKCPRCNTLNLIDYGEIIECPVCKLEFHKKDLLTLDRKEILSISEKIAFMKSIKNNH